MARPTIAPSPLFSRDPLLSEGGRIRWLTSMLHHLPVSAVAVLVTLAGAPLACTSSDLPADGDESRDDTSGEETRDEETSGDGTSGDEPTGSGEFEAIWRQVSADLTFIDAEDPIPKSVNVEIPSLLPFPETDREVELFEQFLDGEPVTYAYVDGASEYYRITTPALASEGSYLVQHGEGLRIYTMEDGRLASLTTLAVGTNVVQTFTKFTEHRGTFPPKTWPDKRVDATVEEAP